MFNVSELIASLNVLDLPAQDELIVLPLVKANRNLIVAVGEEREKPLRGIVLRVGPGGVAPETGRPVTMTRRVGELVLFGRYAGQSIDIDCSLGTIEAYLMRDVEARAYRPADSFDLEAHADGDPRHLHLLGMTCEHCPSADLSAEREQLREEERQASSSSLIEGERERLRQERAAQDAVSSVP